MAHLGAVLRSTAVHESGVVRWAIGSNRLAANQSILDPALTFGSVQARNIYAYRSSLSATGLLAETGGRLLGATGTLIEAGRSFNAFANGDNAEGTSAGASSLAGGVLLFAPESAPMTVPTILFAKTKKPYARALTGMLCQG